MFIASVYRPTVTTSRRTAQLARYGPVFAPCWFLGSWGLLDHPGMPFGEWTKVHLESEQENDPKFLMIPIHFLRWAVLSRSHARIRRCGLIAGIRVALVMRQPKSV